MVSDDFLDEMIAERTKANPEFPRLFDAVAARRRLQEDASVESHAVEASDP